MGKAFDNLIYTLRKKTISNEIEDTVNKIQSAYITSGKDISPEFKALIENALLLGVGIAERVYKLK